MRKFVALMLGIGLHVVGCFAFGPPDGYQCTQNADCDDGEVCVETECDAEPCVHARCLSICGRQSDCDPGMYCSPDGVCVEPTEPSPRISAPAQLVARGGFAEVTLTWRPVDGAKTYNVYWATQPGVTLDSNRIGAEAPPSVHTRLDSNTTYYYALTAADESGESVLSSEVSATTLLAGTKLVTADGQTRDLFGASVAISGDYAVVGASNEDGGDGDPLIFAGAAYVFRRTAANTWGGGTKLAASDRQANDLFGCSVAVSGDYAIVGAACEDGGDGDPLPDAGAAYVFRRTGANTWDAGTRLVAPDAHANDHFGDVVALSGDYAIVGTPDEDGGAGAAYVFHRTDEDTWDSGTKLVAHDAYKGDQFADSVALNGDYAIVGAPYEDGGDGDPTINAGAAYVFFRTVGNTWDSGTKLVAHDAQAYDWFGSSVAVSGDYAIVGAVAEDGGEGDPLEGAGAAYVFRRTSENTWDSGAKIVARDGQEHEVFGVAVALSGDHAVVGAQSTDVGDSDQLKRTGAAYLFGRTGENAWDRGTRLVAPDAQPEDWFGGSVAVSGNRVVVGAPYEDGGDGDSMDSAGAAYVYEY